MRQHEVLGECGNTTGGKTNDASSGKQHNWYMKKKRSSPGEVAWNGVPKREGNGNGELHEDRRQDQMEETVSASSIHRAEFALYNYSICCRIRYLRMFVLNRNLVE